MHPSGGSDVGGAPWRPGISRRSGSNEIILSWARAETLDLRNRRRKHWGLYAPRIKKTLFGLWGIMSTPERCRTSDGTIVQWPSCSTGLTEVTPRTLAWIVEDPLTWITKTCWRS